MKILRIPGIVAIALALLLGLMSVQQTGLALDEPPTDELDVMGEDAIKTLLEHRPDLSEKLAGIPGYAVIAMSTTKIPGVGTGLGYGVIYDNRSAARSYIKVTQFEVGGGLGAQRFKVIILFRDEKPLEKIVKGGWRYESGVDFEAKSDSPEASAPVSSRSGKGYKVFRLAENGAVASITLRLLQARPYGVD